ncbi:MAG: coproporphyrinogen dehydrogenase HemZ [Firmicutes bacterium]|nr:coproporphyrinogen dehydrogenase HemZ [Bacillota bacterium]
MSTIWLDGLAIEHRKTLEDIVRLFFPTAEVKHGQPQQDDQLTSEREEDEPAGWLKMWEEEACGYIAIEAEFSLVGYRGYRVVAHQRETLTAPNQSDAANQRKRVIRLCVLKTLTQATGKLPGPWGILTGIRPTKVVHRLIDEGYSAEDILEIMTEDYAVSPAKARLLYEIARRQRPFLLTPAQAERLVSVYIGIPFCPTRCLYCSFPGYPLARHRAWVEPFVTTLLKEIQVIGEVLHTYDYAVQSIYLGGGTPTSLDIGQLGQLLEKINHYLFSSATKEITVEGGRPETLSNEKLSLLKGMGVNRLSINPQTMRDETLQTIGRAHSAEDIVQAVERARRVGFSTLNMDIIIGLPGETVADVQQTMKQIMKLAPENLTVHTMAIKRASRLKEELVAWKLPTEEEVGRMLEVTKTVAAEMELVPYYLYRQKRILANLENVGYAFPSHECLYNIQVMEERQTIVGLGAGAGSKWVSPADWTLINTYNPKDPNDYIKRINELLDKKKDMLHGLRRKPTH